MTETEKKALELVNEVRAEHGGHPNGIIAKNTYAWDALCRAIEQHEAYKQEVSDALLVYQKADGLAERSLTWDALTRFIIPKHDEASAGLALAIEDALELVIGDEDVNKLRAALAARGLEVRKIGEGE